MEILYSILIILFTVIGLLVFYYITLKKDQKSQENQLPFREAKTEYETGDSLEVGEEFAKEINPEPDTHGKIELTQEEKFREMIKVEVNNDLIQEVKFQEGETRNSYIRLFTRDPRCLFTYWQIDKEVFLKHTIYLRLHNLSNNEYTDIEIKEPSGNWYLKVEPDKVYQISIGYIINGSFLPIRSSKPVQSPLDHPSKIIDEHWMTIEELSGYTFRIEMDSLAISKNIEERKVQEKLDTELLNINQ